MDVRLMNHYIAVQQLPRQTQEGAIVIPDAYLDDEMKCRVIAVGPGKRLANGERYPAEVKVGDTVMLKENVPLEQFKINDLTFIVCTEDDILLVFEEENND